MLDPGAQSQAGQNASSHSQTDLVLVKGSNVLPCDAIVVLMVLAIWIQSAGWIGPAHWVQTLGPYSASDWSLPGQDQALGALCHPCLGGMGSSEICISLNQKLAFH